QPLPPKALMRCSRALLPPLAGGAQGEYSATRSALCRRCWRSRAVPEVPFPDRLSTLPTPSRKRHRGNPPRPKFFPFPACHGDPALAIIFLYPLVWISRREPLLRPL